MKTGSKTDRAAASKLTPIFLIISCLAILIVSPNTLFAFEENTNRPGSDYKSFHPTSPNPQLCQDKCKTDPGLNCKAFTYVKQTNTCWLKGKIPLPKSSTCCTSGVIRENVCVHGNAGQFQSQGVAGSPHGWGMDFDVVGKGSWIQYSIPTKESDMVIEGIQVKFTVSNPKYGWISAIHLYDGSNVLKKFDNQRYGSSLSSEKSSTKDLLLPLSKAIRVSKGIGISILPESDSVKGLAKVVNIKIHSVCVLTSKIH